MPNVIIPLHHQAAPNFRYDPVLAREAAAAEDPHDKTDWDARDWEAEHARIAMRRQMKNQDFDKELETPEHRDDFLLLKQRAYLERIQLRPNVWVEENLKLYEANCNRAKAQHIQGQERWEGREAERMRMVNILHPHSIMRKLRDAGVDARTEEHPNARLWLNEWSAAGLVGVNAWVPPIEMDEEGYLLELSTASTQAAKDYITANYYACHARRKVRMQITSLQNGYAPEWSLMRFSEHGVATKERYRGWRTALLVLIVAEILTEEEVDKAFGPPIGEAGAFYRQQLQAYRNLRNR
jgi:ribosomal protein L39E